MTIYDKSTGVYVDQTKPYYPKGRAGGPQPIPIKSTSQEDPVQAFDKWLKDKGYD